MIELVGAAIALALVAVHLFGHYLETIDRLSRRHWLSISSGASIAYIFVHVLPEIGTAAAEIGEDPFDLGVVEHPVYLVALAGFIAYYGIERSITNGPASPRVDSGANRTSTNQASANRTGATPVENARPNGGRVEGVRVFWMHVLAFGLYNLLVGYLVHHRLEEGLENLLLFGVAMGLHFLVNDWGFRRRHGRAYHDHGRWVLAAAILLGFGAGFLAPIGPLAMDVLFAFLAGGVILNVIKEEIPLERESRFPAFTLGAASYSIVLLYV